MSPHRHNLAYQVNDIMFKTTKGYNYDMILKKIGNWENQAYHAFD